MRYHRARLHDEIVHFCAESGAPLHSVTVRSAAERRIPALEQRILVPQSGTF